MMMSILINKEIEVVSGGASCVYTTNPKTYFMERGGEYCTFAGTQTGLVIDNSGTYLDSQCANIKVSCGGGAQELIPWGQQYSCGSGIAMKVTCASVGSTPCKGTVTAM